MSTLSAPFLRKERTVFTTQTAVSTRPQPLRRLPWSRLRHLLQTAQHKHNWHGTESRRTSIHNVRRSHSVPSSTQIDHVPSVRAEQSSSSVSPVPSRHHLHKRGCEYLPARVTLKGCTDGGGERKPEGNPDRGGIGAKRSFTHHDTCPNTQPPCGPAVLRRWGEQGHVTHWAACAALEIDGQGQPSIAFRI